MTRQGESGQTVNSVEAALNYLVDTGEKPVAYITEPGSGPPRREGRWAAGIRSKQPRPGERP